MKKVLIIGDSPSTPTGFSSVILNIFRHFPREEYELHQLGVNYYGDPHDIPWRIYPAFLKGDIWGMERLPELLERKFDFIFILNDVWVVSNYLAKIKAALKEKTIPPVIVYFPVDAHTFDEEWFVNFDIVSKTIVYTRFAERVVKEVCPNLELTVIPHGVDRGVFDKIDLPKAEVKKLIYPDMEEFYNSFIVLSAQRNQPRKRVDITIESFALFAKGKPENVKLYMHMGLRDAGFDIIKLAKRYGIDDRLIVTNKSLGIQTIPASRLNLIYNATDVGVNTSLGEGWGLVNIEHAITGAPQVVPDHSALTELYEDCGLLVPISQSLTNLDVMTVGGLVRSESVAQRIEELYTNHDLYNTLSEKGLLKFSSPEYDWINISKKFQNLFEEIV